MWELILQVMGEIAPRKEEGRQAGRCVSFYGKVMGFSWERAGSLFRCARTREGQMANGADP